MPCGLPRVVQLGSANVINLAGHTHIQVDDNQTNDSGHWLDCGDNIWIEQFLEMPIWLESRRFQERSGCKIRGDIKQKNETPNSTWRGSPQLGARRHSPNVLHLPTELRANLLGIKATHYSLRRKFATGEDPNHDEVFERLMKISAHTSRVTAGIWAAHLLCGPPIEISKLQPAAEEIRSKIPACLRG